MAMAAVIEGDVKKNLLDRTDAEKVFRPWWDTLEDYLLNILILIGQAKYLHMSRFSWCQKVFQYKTQLRGKARQRALDIWPLGRVVV